jgi:AraC-like DNA-binding protein
MLAACLEAGFGSYPQFHRVFVAETGRTPRDYLGNGFRTPTRAAPARTRRSGR